MMDDQTYANMMKRSQWNFAQKKNISLMGISYETN